MSKLTAQALTKSYGKKEVLHNIDLILESGKIYGLIGRNGTGKTTLLSILTAQNPATAGTITLDGHPVWENPEVLSQLCFSRELTASNGSGLAAMKIKEYLKIAATFYPHWDKEMAESLVQKFHLDIKQKLGKISKGMLSMVTIITAMASKAPFTFLDEPVAGLDVIAREQFYQLLLDEYTETGRTFVVSTHIIEEASDIFEEVIIVDKGEILLKENTQELLNRAYHISGHEDLVKAARQQAQIYHEEHIGRSMGATVLLQLGQELEISPELRVQKPNLQKLFVALCGEE